jgi:hypothetical protein
MISAIILLGAFNSDHIADIFNNTNCFLLAHAIGTDRTDITIRYIVTTLAKFYLIAHLGDHFAELLHIIFFLL